MPPVLSQIRRAAAGFRSVWSARRFARGSKTDLIVCWDLDNTLVDSGALLGQGLSLADAAVEAAPMRLMHEFFDALADAIPRAQHVVLSARERSLRSATADWLARHEFAFPADRVWLVPDAHAKLAVWRCLAKHAQLVIVDDLSYGHEGSTRAQYDDLVEVASRLAAVYLGLAEISKVAAEASAGPLLATQIAEHLRLVRSSTGADAVQAGTT